VNIDDKLITYLEELANFTLTDDEKAKLTADLPQVFDSLTKLVALDTGDAQELIQPIERVNVFREDIAAPPFGRELILQNAQVRNEEAFIAPRTVE